MLQNSENILVNYHHNINDIVDCQIMHIKDICETLNFPLSGAMCFGLSEAFDFSYWIERSSNIPYLIMIGKTKNALETFFNKMKIPFRSININTEAEFNEHIQDNIINNTVSLAYVDRYYLSYLEKKFKRAHFGNHLISISGYRNIDSVIEYAINDFISDDPIWFSADDIQKARLSTWKPFSPDGLVIDVLIDGLNLELLKENIPRMIVDSIWNVTNKMLSGTNSGVGSINALSSEISYLQNVDYEKYKRAINFQLKLIASFISDFEESHTLYRMDFSFFLSEASEKFGLSYLSNYSNRMKEIAAEWFSLSKLTESFEDVATVLSEFSRKLSALSGLEKSFFIDIYHLILNQQNSI